MVISLIAIKASNIYMNGALVGKVRRYLTGFRANITIPYMDSTITVVCKDCEDRKHWPDMIMKRLHQITQSLQVDSIVIANYGTGTFKIELPLTHRAWNAMAGFHTLNLRGLIRQRDWRGIMVDQESSSLLPVDVQLRDGVVVHIGCVDYDWSDASKTFVCMPTRKEYNIAQMCELINSFREVYRG